MIMNLESRSERRFSRWRIDWYFLSRPSDCSIDVIDSNERLMKCCSEVSSSPIRTLNST
jgi:hypothetical protein